jgi:hypothetical protein
MSAITEQANAASLRDGSRFSNHGFTVSTSLGRTPTTGLRQSERGIRIPGGNPISSTFSTIAMLRDEGFLPPGGVTSARVPG